MPVPQRLFLSHLSCALRAAFALQWILAHAAKSAFAAFILKGSFLKNTGELALESDLSSFLHHSLLIEDRLLHTAVGAEFSIQLVQFLAADTASENQALAALGTELCSR